MQHFISQREEFETARDGILVWLTEMDLQLTNIEHFSECDIQAKIKQLRVRLSQFFTYPVHAGRPKQPGLISAGKAHSLTLY